MMKKKQRILTLIYGQISNEKYIPKHLIILLKKFGYIFRGRHLINFKNRFSKRDHQNR